MYQCIHGYRLCVLLASSNNTSYGCIDDDEGDTNNTGRIATDNELKAVQMSTVPFAHTQNFEPLNNKKAEAWFTGNFEPLNSAVRILTSGQGEDKVWHRLRPCTISSTGAIKLARVANKLAHASGSEIHSAVTFLAERLGLRSIIIEDLQTKARVNTLVDDLRSHKIANDSYFEPVIVTATSGVVKTKNWFDQYLKKYRMHYSRISGQY